MRKPSTAAGAIVLATALIFVGLTAVFATNFDFRAFYCAGAAVRVHANPYHTEPLHTCERTQTDGAFAVFARSAALPAPQPGYDMAVFALLAALPFAIAAKVWSVLLAGSIVAAVVLVRKTSGEALAPIVAALWLSLGVASAYLGEIVPFCVCAVAAAAWFAQECRWTGAGIAAAATLVEPHIGIPVFAGLLLWAPKARVSLALCTLGLAALSVAVVGVHANVEYVAAVLPAHALSEIGSDAQVSFSVLMHAIGLPDRLALNAGTASYVAAVILGLAFARGIEARFDDASFLLTTPAAFAVLGGVFMHVTEIAAAIPLIFMLLKHVNRERDRRVIVAALVLLAIPWWSFAMPMLLHVPAGFVMVRLPVAFAAMTATFLLWAYYRNAAVALIVGLLAFAATSSMVHGYAAQSNALLPLRVPKPEIDAIYPEASWALANARYLSTGVLPAFVLRAPTWAGLILVAFACARTALSRSRLAVRLSVNVN